ncbi:MAG: sel1 repeat family protein [Alphaproteobacteria bacterium]|nr:sel1 repeat family protein [Alphaproteobacteria bacterium]
MNLSRLRKHADIILVMLLLYAAVAYLPRQEFFDAYQIPGLEAAANKGDIAAQSELANRYYYGIGVKTSTKEFLKWAHFAASEGDAHAQTLLGYFYMNYTRSHKEGLYWARKAAEQQWPRGERFLGWLYSNGIGVEEDPAKAVEWWMKAAEHGDEGSALNLGNYYAHGSGVPQSYEESLKWYRVAAKLGSREAKWRVMKYNWNAFWGDEKGAEGALSRYDGTWGIFHTPNGGIWKD